MSGRGKGRGRGGVAQANDSLPGQPERLDHIPCPSPRHTCVHTSFHTFIQGVDLDGISAQLDGYSGDDITNICRDAAMNGMRRIMAGKTPAELKRLREMGQVRGVEGAGQASQRGSHQGEPKHVCCSGSARMPFAELKCAREVGQV